MAVNIKIQVLENRTFPNENGLCIGSNFPRETLLFSLPRVPDEGTADRGGEGAGDQRDEQLHFKGMRILNEDTVQVRLEYVGSETLFVPLRR